MIWYVGHPEVRFCLAAKQRMAKKTNERKEIEEYLKLVGKT
jgi:hypothetical protein